MEKAIVNDLNKIQTFLIECWETKGRQLKSEEIAKVLGRLNKIAIKENNQRLVDIAWCLKEISSLYADIIAIYLMFKEEKFYDAWCVLEVCEIRINSIKKLNVFELKKLGLFSLLYKISKLQMLYPYRLFASPEFLILERKCSICEEVVSLRKSCGHVKGNVYDGDQCLHIVSKSELLAISLVEDPHSKYRVIMNAEGDKYDYTLLKYISDNIDSIFDDWDYKWTKRVVLKSEFEQFAPNELCPCRSEKLFSDCCKDKDFLEMDHIDFFFDINTFKKNKDLKQHIVRMSSNLLPK